jgi:hypothetical protein
MENLKGVELIISIASQLIVEASVSKEEMVKKLRCHQASCLIKACSDLSNKSLIDLLLLSKSLSLEMGKDFEKFERTMEADDILKKIFNEEKNNDNNG